MNYKRKQKRPIVCVSNHAKILGGGEISFLDLIINLPKTWKVTAVVPAKEELYGRLSINKIDTEIIPIPSLRPWLACSIFLSFFRFLHLFQKLRPSLIYANGSRAAFYTGIIGRILKIPVVWHCRIADPDIYLDPILCRLCARIIANSHATTGRFKEHYQHKVSIIYNGINIEWLQDDFINNPPRIQPGWKTILVVARISRWKRHDIALSVFEKVASSDRKIQLVCVGAEDDLEPEWYKYLVSRTNQSPYSDRIHWIGQVDDVRPWYKSASTLLLPSDNEPFGRVIVEAMACGLPVIATNSGGIPEIITNEQDGLLVSMENIDEIANTIFQILSDNSLRNKIIENARTRAKNFNIETHINKMENLFGNTINN